MRKYKKKVYKLDVFLLLKNRKNFNLLPFLRVIWDLLIKNQETVGLILYNLDRNFFLDKTKLNN